jgi:hypothetical protein
MYFAVLALVAGWLMLGVGTASADKTLTEMPSLEKRFDAIALGPQTRPEGGQLTPAGITECPHAGEPADKNPKPLDQVAPDKVAQLSNGGDDVKVNQDYTCLPQNETSVFVNPLNYKNVVAGQNDYQLGWGTSGFDASTDNGNHWEHRIRAFPTAGTPLLSPVLLSDDHIDGGGDPAIVFDRGGVAYYVDIHFERERDDNGIFVARSTNGGFTWSRPCTIRVRNATCGAVGDPRTPGDGVVVFDEDPDGTGPTPAPAFNDKEWITAGPRPAGVNPTCFEPGFVDAVTGLLVGRNPMPCDPATIGKDRLYVTWTRFDLGTAPADINLSYSDDQGRSWSPRKVISGSAPFCITVVCDLNQFSNPTVNPTTGELWVGFENFNTNDENQYLVVRSNDGGQTFTGPFFVSFIFDVNYPQSGGNRPDCSDRGQADTNVLTNSCFRTPTAANIAADKRGGAFSDDLYVTFADNRNGTQESSNTDVWFFKSTDGGMTWIGPTRVNNDPSESPANRDCGSCPPNVHTGNDQYFPWVDISLKGDVNVGFYDRRLDTTSTLSEWPESRTRTPGNYLSWYWDGACSITGTATVGASLRGLKVSQLPPTAAAAAQCLAPNAEVITPPTGPLEDPDSTSQFGGPGFVGAFKNATLSDVPSNHDYSFRAGIFIGDYTNVAIGPDGTAYAIWADSRNGRGSGTGGSNVNQQPGRNPACEQADIFLDSFSAQSPGTAKQPPSMDVINAFSVTPCPPGMLRP